MNLAERIARELSRVVGVEAVVLGGSRASGRSDAASDVDLGIYYAAGSPPSQAALARVATDLQHGVPAALAAPGAWGPWVNGGGWLHVADETVGEVADKTVGEVADRRVGEVADKTVGEVADRRVGEVADERVDWILRDLGRVDEVFDACLAGTVTCDYSLGHPHGFHNHYYLAEIHHCIPLHDPRARVARLKARVVPYPPMLRQALVEKYLYDAGFMLELARKSAPRGDVLHASGCVFRCAAALVQVLFALNAQFTMNEKQSLAATRSFAVAPSGFAGRVQALLAAPGGDPPALTASLDAMHALLAETHALAPPLAYAFEGREDG